MPILKIQTNKSIEGKQPFMHDAVILVSDFLQNYP